MKNVRPSTPRLLPILTALLAVIVAAVPPSTAANGAADASLFEAIKGLAGDWSGQYGEEGGKLRFEVTSGGNTVVQTEFPGEHHEMRTLYWLEDGRLVAQHFCMLGNQPRYEVESPDGGATLRFVFAGGSNLDPTRDHHAHEGVMTIGAGTLESTWTFWKDGTASETNTFRLHRVE